MGRPPSSEGRPERLLAFAVILLCLPISAGAKYEANIVVIEVNASSLTFEIRKSGPALDLALERVRELYKDTIDFKYHYRETTCGPNPIGAVAAEAFYTIDVDIFIGAGCSVTAEPLGYLAAWWNRAFITTVGSSILLTNKTVFPTLTRPTRGDIALFINLTKLILRRYSWYHIAMVYDQDDIFASLVGPGFIDGLHEENLFLRRVELSSISDTTETIREKLRSAATVARVFFVAADVPFLRIIMMEARNLGYTTSGEFVFLTFLRPTFQVDTSIWKWEAYEVQARKEAFQSSLIMSLTPPNETLFRAFGNEMVRRSLRDYGYDYGKTQPSELVANFYDSVTIFAQVLNETLAAGGDPKDGRAFSRAMWNRTYDGIIGRVALDAQGNRDSDLDVSSFKDPEEGTFHVVLTYLAEDRVLAPVPDAEIYWPAGAPPLDIPLCGFRGELCSDNGQTLRIIIGTSMAVGTFAVAFLSVMVFLFRKTGGPIRLATRSFREVKSTAKHDRRWRRGSYWNLWWWKVEPTDVLIRNQASTTFSGSICSVHSTKTMNKQERYISSSLEPASFFITYPATFKGQAVRCLRLPTTSVQISSGLLKDFGRIRDINHNNVARIIGGHLESSNPFLLTEWGSKGTLQDLLGQSDIKLDHRFLFFITMDVIQGMEYLHSMGLVHGRLSSMVCLVDKRFTVKVADFGPKALFNQIRIDPTSQEYKIGCLWRAPEHLRESGNAETKAGDVYSFAITLQEILTRDPPFAQEMEFMRVEEVLRKVKIGDTPPFRPKVETSHLSQELHVLYELMTQCWVEDPASRPTFIAIKKNLRKTASQFGVNGSLVEHMLHMMEQYANNLEQLVEERTRELKAEKKRSEELLYQILPRVVADRLRLGLPVEPEAFECVTIYFSDIVDFTLLSSESSPLQIVTFLNDLYSCFDESIEYMDVYKVETIGDAYMVVSGLPQRNGDKHASEIAHMAVVLLDKIKGFRIQHKPDAVVQLRIGIHSGPVCAGVVGLKMPRYCLFGDTVNTASRMETTGEPLKIHISQSTRDILTKMGTFQITDRGDIFAKGKGTLRTYWLVGDATHSGMATSYLSDEGGTLF